MQIALKFSSYLQNLNQYIIPVNICLQISKLRLKLEENEEKLQLWITEIGLQFHMCHKIGLKMWSKVRFLVQRNQRESSRSKKGHMNMVSKYFFKNGKICRQEFIEMCIFLLIFILRIEY